MRPLLSIVTGTVDREASMVRLVAALESTIRIPWELVVADGSKRPYSLRWPKDTLVIPDGGQTGCVKAYNRAFRRATGRYVCWLNDDAEPQPGWCEAALNFMESNPDVGIGALYWRDPHEEKWHYNVAYWGVPYANFGIIPRDLGDRLGWFDEDLYMYGCDVSLSWKCWLAGLGVVGIRGARILHHRVQDERRINNQKESERNRDVDRLFDRYKIKRGDLSAIAARFSKRQPSPEEQVVSLGA